MTKSKPLPPLAELQQVLSYEPETGVFRWKSQVNARVKAGWAAGTINNCGYIMIKWKGRLVSGHRLAWLFYHETDPGELQIDHENGNKQDNRIENLRLATHGENRQNSALPVNNSSGFKGVSRHRRTGLWVASVRANKKKYCSKGFATPEAAYEWACAKRKELHAEFVNHGVHVAASATLP